VASPQSGFSSTDSRSNLEILVFVEGGKPKNPEKNRRSKDENQQQTHPTYETGTRNKTQVTLVGDGTLTTAPSLLGPKIVLLCKPGTLLGLCFKLNCIMYFNSPRPVPLHFSEETYEQM